MTNETMIRNMNTNELASFLTEILTNQDSINRIYRETCRRQCPISGNTCPVGGTDGACPYDTDAIVTQWLKTEA